MAEVLRCDQCKRVQPVFLVAGWQKVSVLGDARSIEEPDDLHFCGRTCLAFYYAVTPAPTRNPGATVPCMTCGKNPGVPQSDLHVYICEACFKAMGFVPQPTT